MAKNRSNGEGTWYQPAKGGWAFVVTTGWNPVKKKQDRKAFYGPTKEVVRRKHAEWAAEGSPVAADPEATVGKAVHAWMRSRRDQVDPASLEAYEDHLNR